jgi:hypothetical protein
LERATADIEIIFVFKGNIYSVNPVNPVTSVVKVLASEEKKPAVTKPIKLKADG